MAPQAGIVFACFPCGEGAQNTRRHKGTRTSGEELGSGASGADAATDRAD